MKFLKKMTNLCMNVCNLNEKNGVKKSYLKLWLGKDKKKKKNSNKRDREQLKRIGENGQNWFVKPLKIIKLEFWLVKRNQVTIERTVIHFLIDRAGIERWSAFWPKNSTFSIGWELGPINWKLENWNFEKLENFLQKNNWKPIFMIWNTYKWF